MMKKNIILILFLCVFLGLEAQSQTANITGTVFDETTKEAIELASIRVLNAKDSAYVAGGVTNKEGKFAMNVKPGNYIVQVSFLSYLNQFFNINTREKTNLGDIYLKDDGIMLNEATVTAKAVEIQVKGDTVEYNAGSYRVQESAVVEDLVKKMPGAEVDSEGKITVNGKEVKKILVDGKEFFSSDPKVASKNLPAAMIEKLQVVDRKSDMAQMTGFDDGEEETVLNLTIKKGMKEGLTGSVTAGMGSDDRYGVSGIANYMRNESQFTLMGGSNNTNNAGFTDNAGGTFRGMRGGGMGFGGRNGITQSNSGGFNFATETSEKLKWGGNIRFGDTDNDVNQTGFTQRYLTNSTRGDQYENRKSFGNNQSTNFGSDFRFEWAPDTLTKIIFSPNFQYGKNTNRQASDYLTTYADPSDSVNWGSSKMFSDGNNKSVSGRLEFSRQLGGKKGRVLSFSIGGGYNDLENDGSNWSQTIMRRDNQADSLVALDQRFNQRNKGYNWSGYASYVEPIGWNNFIQVNYSYNKSYSESDKRTLKLNDESKDYDIIDTTATKKLENDFVNQQIGVNFKSVREKYNYTIGVALQPSNSESWTIIPQSRTNVSNDVLNFAPVAQFNYLWDRRHNLRIDYNGRTGQPSATQLSSVRDESNPLDIVYGNPNLKPSFSNRLRLRYMKSVPERGSMLAAFGGFNFSSNDIVSRTKNLIEQGIRETTYDNINGNWNADLRVIFNTPLRNKKFSVNAMTFGRYQQSNAYINDDKNTASTLTLAENMGIRFNSDFADFGLRGSINYSNTQNSLPNQEDRALYNYGGGFNTTFRLPYSFTIDSDINYSANSGYSEGYNQKEWLWNASVSKQFMKGKKATVKVDVYDILNQRTNISSNPGATSYSQTVTNTLGRYFMVSFAYRFQIFKGGAKHTDMEGGEDFGPGRGRGFGGPPGGGRPGGGPPGDGAF